VNRGRRWYLVCWDRARDDWRTFRVDRIGEPVATGPRFRPRRLPAVDPAAFVEQRLASMPMRYEARLTLHAPAERVRVPGGTVTPVDGSSCEYRTGDDDLAWLALRVAMLGVEFELHEPAELGDALRAMAGRILRGTG